MEHTQEQSSAVLQAKREPSNGGTATIEDNRPETVYQRKLRASMNNSPRSRAEAPLRKTINAYAASNALPIQRKKSPSVSPRANPSTGPRANNTGLPDNLKSGIENLSGYAIDDVKVHYNSSKPAQMRAHAYAQGTDIHVAPGQEKHLPHEAWHIVQQKQGRVKPTLQLKEKVNVNDDAGLEQEADVMGARATQATAERPNLLSGKKGGDTLQRVVEKKRIIRLYFAGSLRNSSLFLEFEKCQVASP